jgi:2-aminoethylphosphonate-pyruvate transaminase
MGLKLLLNGHESNTVTSVFLPEGVPAQAFLDEMELRGYVFYIGKGNYAKQNMIQVANMGEIYEQDCHNMLRVFKDCLADMKKA